MKPGHAAELAKLMAAFSLPVQMHVGGPPVDDVAPLSLRRAGGPFPARGWALTLSPDDCTRPWVGLTYSEGGWTEVFWCHWTTRN